MVEEKVRNNLGSYLSNAEVMIYSILAILLFVAALAVIASTGKCYSTGRAIGLSQVKQFEFWINCSLF